MLEHPTFAALVVGMTSLALGAVGVATGRYRLSALPNAARHALERVGTALALFVLNLVVALVVVGLAQATGHESASPYSIDDLMLFVLSALQAVSFASWRVASPGVRRPGPVERA